MVIGGSWLWETRGASRRIVPFHACRKRSRAVLEVKDPPPGTAHGLAGGMEEEGAHQQRIAGERRAQHLRGRFPNSRNLGGLESAVPMRAGNHPQRAIRGIAIVQVQAHGQHSGQPFPGCLNMRNPVLEAPRTETRCLHRPCHGEGHVLMPRDQPVRSRGLVEKDRSDGSGRWAQMRRNERGEGFGLGPFSDGWESQQSSRTGSCGVAQRSQQGLAFRSTQHVPDPDETIPFEGGGIPVRGSRERVFLGHRGQTDRLNSLSAAASWAGDIRLRRAAISALARTSQRSLSGWPAWPLSQRHSMR